LGLAVGQEFGRATGRANRPVSHSRLTRHASSA